MTRDIENHPDFLKQIKREFDDFRNEQRNKLIGNIFRDFIGDINASQESGLGITREEFVLELQKDPETLSKILEIAYGQKVGFDEARQIYEMQEKQRDGKLDGNLAIFDKIYNAKANYPPRLSRAEAREAEKLVKKVKPKSEAPKKRKLSWKERLAGKKTTEIALAAQRARQTEKRSF